MDERPLAALRTPACSCIKVETAIRNDGAAGFHVKLGYEIISASAHDVEGDVGNVSLSYNTSGTTITDGSGKVVRRQPSVQLGIKEMAFQLVGGQWLVTTIESYT